MLIPNNYDVCYLHIQKYNDKKVMALKGKYASEKEKRSG